MCLARAYQAPRQLALAAVATATQSAAYRRPKALATHQRGVGVHKQAQAITSYQEAFRRGMERSGLLVVALLGRENACAS